ncbi:MAG: polysaccharide deacetylase family protein [Clostridia bacterium]|nr:polysaccharide deacetylase family protein [Clostridia bacterium]
MKNIILKLPSLILVIISILNITAAAVGERGECWFIKRHGTERPDFPSGADRLSEYNAFFIDDNLGEGERKIYLTFDAGYENGNVERILDAMKEAGAVGAFFLLDNIILKNTDLVKRMKDEGHLVCNHTLRHKNLSGATPEEIATDLTSLELLYLDKTGEKMDKYFRFPEGRYSESSLKAVSELGYKTVFWSFAYDDWDNARQMPNDKAINKVLSNTHNGAVMLFHPTSKTNAEIFPKLLSEWKKMGYTFGTLDELCSK